MAQEELDHRTYSSSSNVVELNESREYPCSIDSIACLLFIRRDIETSVMCFLTSRISYSFLRLLLLLLSEMLFRKERRRE